MIATVLAFLGPFGRFLKPYAGYLLIAALVGLALWGVHHRGYREGVKHEQAVQAERVKKAQKRVQEGEKKADAATAAISEKHVQTVEKIRWRTETLTREVKVYVPQTVDRATFISNGAISLHNAAIDGSSLPETPGGSFEAPSGIAQSQFVSTIIDNYGTCHTWKSELDTWRRWYVEQREIYNATVKAP